jgi:hypothetical protein
MWRLRGVIGTSIRRWAVLAGIATGWATYHALASAREAASGWWQVAIAFASLPLVFVQLATIQEELRRAQWRPQIRIGVAPVGPLAPLASAPLAHHCTAQRGYPFFQLLVKNEGRLAAKWVKIHLEFESFGDSSYQDYARSPIDKIAAPRLHIPKDNPFTWQNNRDFVFNGGADWVIHPYDTVSFPFFVQTVVKDHPPVPCDYSLKATVFAEGIESPVAASLTVSISEEAP